MSERDLWLKLRQGGRYVVEIRDTPRQLIPEFLDFPSQEKALVKAEEFEAEGKYVEVWDMVLDERIH